MPRSISPPPLDPLEDVRLRFLPEPFQPGHLALLAGPLQLFHTPDVQFVVQGLDLLRSQPGHLQHRCQSGRRGGLELLVIRQLARRHQFPNLLLQRLADPLNLPQPPFGHNLVQRLVQGLHRARPVQVGPGLERILPFQLQQRRYAHQNLCNLILVHASNMKPKPQKSRPGARA